MTVKDSTLPTSMNNLNTNPTLGTSKNGFHFSGSATGKLPPTRSLPIDRKIDALASIAIVKDTDDTENSHCDKTSPDLSDSTTTLIGSVSSLGDQKSDLQTHLTSLSHTLFLKNQRDSLKSSLAASKIDATRLRALSLRLAAKVATRDQAIEQRDRLLSQRLLAEYLAGRKSAHALEKLRTSISVYEKQGAGLLSALSGVGIEGVMPSPPYGSLRPRSTSSDDGEYLPSEILEICQYRVDALLRECRLSRDTLVLLRETEEGLRQDAKEQETKIDELQRQKARSDAEAESLNRQMSILLVDLAASQQQISSLKHEREDLLHQIQRSDMENEEMKTEKKELDDASEQLKKTLYTAQQKLQSAIHKADLLQKSKLSMDEIIKNLEAKGVANEYSFRQTSSRLAAANEQIANLVEEYQAQTKVISLLEFDLAQCQEQVNKQGRYAQQAAVHASRRELEISNEVFMAKKALREAEERLGKEQNNQEGLRQAQETLRQSLHKQNEVIQELESSKRKAVAELEATKATHKSFIESSDTLGKELEGQKAKTLSLMETENRLKLQISDYERVTSRLTIRVQELEAALASEHTKSSENAEVIQAIRSQLSDGQQILSEVKEAHREQLREILGSQAELQQALISAQGEIAGLQHDLEQSSIQSTSLAIQVDNLRHDLDKSRQEASEQTASYTINMANFRVREADHKKIAETQILTIADRDNTIKQLVLQQEILSTENKALQTEIENFDNDRTNYNQQLNDLHAQLSRREAIRKDQELALQTQRARVEHLKAARRELQAKLRSGEHNSARLEEELSTSMKQIERMSVRLTEFQAKVDHYTAHSIELREQVEGLQKSASEKESSIEDVKTKHFAAMEALHSRFIAMEKAHETAQVDLLAKERSLDDSRNHSLEIGSRHELELSKLKSNIQDLRKKLDAQCARSSATELEFADQAERQSIDAAEKSKEVHALKIQLEQQKHRRLQIEASLAEQKASTSSLRHQLEEQTKQAIDLNVELKTLRRSTAQVSRLSELEAKNKELEEQNQALESRHTEISAKYSSLQERSFDLESRNTGFVKKTLELEETVRSRDRANSIFHQQFRTLQKRATEADRRVMELERTIQLRDQRVAQLHREAEVYALHIQNLEVQLGQSGTLRPGNRPSTPIRTASTPLAASNSPPSSFSPAITESSPSYLRRESRSQSGSIDRDSLLRSSVGHSTSPSRQETSVITDVAADDELDHPSIIPDSPDSRQSNHRRVVFDQQRASTSHSMRSLFSTSRPTTPMGFGSFRHSTAWAKQAQPDVDCAPAANEHALLRRRGTGRSSHVLDNVDEDEAEKKVWGEKHPRLWKLMHVGRGKSVQGSLVNRGEQGALNGHRRAASHML